MLVQKSLVTPDVTSTDRRRLIYPSETSVVRSNPKTSLYLNIKWVKAIMWVIKIQPTTQHWNGRVRT